MDREILLLKREIFALTIRRQALEKTFKVKRDQSSIEIQPSKISPNCLLRLIHEKFKNKEFKELLYLLRQYNDEYLMNLNLFIDKGQDHLVQPKKVKVLRNILKLKDVARNEILQHYRFDCLNQTLIIIINFTYSNGYNMVNCLLDQGILKLILSNVLPRIIEQLEYHFDKCSMAFLNICQILINLVLDDQHSQQNRIKEAILYSQLIQLSQFILKKGMGKFTLKNILSLFGLLIQEENIIQILNIISFCVEVIKQDYFGDTTYQQALKLLIQLSKYSQTLRMTRVVWPKILHLNQYPLQYTSLFLNFANEQTNQQLINNGIIEKLVDQLYNKKLDIVLVGNIFKLFNNFLSQPCSKLVEICLNRLILYLNKFILDKVQGDTMEEYLLIFVNLFSNQLLSNHHIQTLIFKIDFVTIIFQILHKNPLCLKWIPFLLKSIDGLQLEFKQCIFKKFQSKLNQLIEQQHCDEDDEILRNIIAMFNYWSQECKTMN